jgi:glycosyltransferase involved in cell wall biosynthesis
VKPVDIVIPSAGRPLALLALLEALFAHGAEGLAAGQARLIVSDDRADAELGAQLRARWPGLRYVAGPGRGPAANRNHGARRGTAAWIVFIDDDCLPVSDLLAGYAAALAETPCAAVLQGAVGAIGEAPDPHHVAPVNHDAGVLLSGNFAIRRAVFESLGGFDTRFPHALEDSELMLRLRRRGLVPRYVSAARVLHPWRRIAPHEVLRHAVGHAVMAELHPEFRHEWGALNLARALRARMRRYLGGRWWAIPARQAFAVALDLASPVIATAAVRWPWLRGALIRRHAQAFARLPGATPLP